MHKQAQPDAPLEQRRRALLSLPRSSVGASGWRSGATDVRLTRKLDSTRRWSGVGCVPTLERGNDNGNTPLERHRLHSHAGAWER